jgi:hypothetical protein
MEQSSMTGDIPLAFGSLRNPSDQTFHALPGIGQLADPDLLRRSKSARIAPPAPVGHDLSGDFALFLPQAGGVRAVHWPHSAFTIHHPPP